MGRPGPDRGVSWVMGEVVFLLLSSCGELLRSKASASGGGLGGRTHLLFWQSEASDAVGLGGEVPPKGASWNGWEHQGSGCRRSPGLPLYGPNSPNGPDI